MKVWKALLCLILSMVFVLASNQYSYANKKAIPNQPKEIAKRHSPVMVEFDGNDSTGAKLATRLKEVFNSSNLFQLQGKDVPKFRVVISSVPEFESRPSVGSAYSVVWLFSMSDDTLRHYLAMEVGVITPTGVNDLATKLVEETDTLALRYEYLFPDAE